MWYAASIASVLLVCLVRIINEPRFFFWDDTQLGAFGQWYGLGSKILSGQVSLLSPGSWQGGNYLAEGQWGIWNPITWLIALGAHVFDNATLFSTVIKVGFLLVLATGAYLLAREYGADPWWAALGGFTATMGGQTIFMDAPSWVTGLQNVALFSLCWWALRRHVSRSKSPVPFFVFSYVLVTFGYVFGVIELAVLLLLMLFTAHREAGWAQSRRVLVLGVYAGLLTVFAYLPGLLTSPVTSRSGSDILNDQFLNMDLGDLATSAITTATSSVRGYWGDIPPVPLQYVSWLLPLLVLFLPVSVKVVRSLTVPLAVLAVTLAFVLGPSVIGPIRYPARMMPYAVLAIAVIFAVVASRRATAPPSRGRVVLAVGLTALAGWLSWAAQPSSWSIVAIATTLQVAVIAVVFVRWGSRPPLGGLPRASAALLLAGSLIVMTPQLMNYRSSPLGNFNVPSSASAMADVGNNMEHGVITIGDVYALQRNPDSYEESLLANLWYLTGKDTASVYTVLPFTALSNELCMDLRGYTCPEALDVLFEGPGATVADDMSLNTVVVVKGERLSERPTTPPGWTVEEGEFTWLLHRTDPVPRAGGVARTSEGVQVSTLARDDTTVTLRVDAVPEEGGDVIFSRLAWPGYTTTAGAFASPERDYLLTLNIDQGDVGETVTVTFRPPGWAVEVVAAAAAGVIGITWSLVWWRARRRESEDRGSSLDPLR